MPPQSEATPPAQIAVRQDREAQVISVAGHLDLDTVGPLDEALQRAASEGPHPVVIDLSGTDFADSSAVNVLLRAYSALGTGLRLVAPSPFLQRLFTLTGLDGVLPLYPSVPKAVGADA
ncbi:STAS domain-containing protein [Streptomyces sp. NPDC056411]|uniref:STAS domain-containing protein n=1 Tax=Streptomyces sp. NPDC056411 TaxID=3345813 RepID=UPI0035D7EF0B